MGGTPQDDVLVQYVQCNAVKFPKFRHTRTAKVASRHWVALSWSLFFIVLGFYFILFAFPFFLKKKTPSFSLAF